MVEKHRDMKGDDLVKTYDLTVVLVKKCIKPPIPTKLTAEKPKYGYKNQYIYYTSSLTPINEKVRFVTLKM